MPRPRSFTDPLTGKVWGNPVAVSVLRTNITRDQRRFDEILNTPVGGTYSQMEVVSLTKALGEWHEALGLHLQAQASSIRVMGEDEVTVLAKE